ncbi:MAG TPA: bifunctional acetate--CoA ligase family protein/GNAT family N-acetyltransferase [Gammaproteobacteria bacterium]|nr:bifunctional acetate--CoA ligase family protein/GNAT family N-acetyltransferase [Gammaproteobacteria bacterium]
MTTRNLKSFLRPSSVVVVGASDKSDTIGGIAVRNVLDSGFAGEVQLVNRRRPVISGRRTLADVEELDEAAELAVIATPCETVPDILRALGERGTKAAVVLTTDLREGPGHAFELRRAMLQAAQPNLVRIIGPDSLGVLSTPAGLNASFAPVYPPAGRLAFVAQSGANLTAVADWAMERGIGFSHLVSLGEMCDADPGDWLDYLATDRDTDAILVYLKDVTQARKFMSAARGASRLKPVIVFRGGRFSVERDQAGTVQAREDAVYDAAFRRAGMLRVNSFEAFFDAVSTLANVPRFRGDRLALLTNGYNMGLVAVDALYDRGGRLAQLSDETRRRLDEVLPKQWWGDNPVDLLSRAGPQQYAQAMQVLLSADEVDALAVLHSPTALTSTMAITDSVIEVARGRRNVLVNWLGGRLVRAARERFVAAGIPAYGTPDQAMHAFEHIVEYRRNQRQLMETPPSVPDFNTHPGQVRQVIDAALSEGRTWLDEAETAAVMSAYGISVVETTPARDSDEVYDFAARLGSPVAVKITSPDIGHKGSVGGVALDLDTPEAAKAAADAMAKRMRRLRPDAHLAGFTVQPMVRRPATHELVAGIFTDPTFGPVVFFGHGGPAVDALRDTAVALPPLNVNLARDLMAHTRIYRVLEGAGGLPAVDLDALALVLIQLSQLAADFAEVSEMRINPLLASPQGAVALDVDMHVAPAQGPAHARLAIRPYPKKLERGFELPDGQQALLRPIRPEDEPAIKQMFQQLDPQERYFRFFASFSELTHPMAARLTQIDYDREMAWVVAEPEAAGRARIFAVVRLIAEPDNERGEFALLVHHEYAGKGIGTRLMRILLDYARERGIGEVYGEILAQNRGMQRICDKLGFKHSFAEGDMGVVHVSYTIDGKAAPSQAAGGAR